MDTGEIEGRRYFTKIIKPKKRNTLQNNFTKIDFFRLDIKESMTSTTQSQGWSKASGAWAGNLEGVPSPVAALYDEWEAFFFSVI